MTERPILFSAPMVRAILEGRKTQTRRVFKVPTPDGKRAAITSPDEEIVRFGDGTFHYLSTGAMSGPYPCPYGAIGDLLWVRETWAHYQCVDHIRRSDGRAFSEVSDGLAAYRADGYEDIEDLRKHIMVMSGLACEAVEINGDRWRPSIHMPRWASRITLEITGVRVERLLDVSADDAVAEGWPHAATGGVGVPLPDAYPIGWYLNLWDDINGLGSAEKNPWVWVITFKRVQP